MTETLAWVQTVALVVVAVCAYGIFVRLRWYLLLGFQSLNETLSAKLTAIDNTLAAINDRTRP